MRRRALTFAGALLAASVPGSAAAAQEDFRSADPDRPILVEDATTIKFREWETELGLRGRLAEGGSGLLGIAELKAGLLRNVQFGVEAEVVLEDAGAAVGGLETVGLHAMYGMRRETSGGPALALRADVSTPGAGPLGHDGWSAGLKGIATRSFGRLRIHGNAGYTAAADEDGGDFWRGGIAFDYPIGLFSKALLGDVYAEVPTTAGPTRVWLELGTRWQVANESVLDVGIATRLDAWDRGEANVEIVIGVSRIFGVPGLIRVPPLGHPSIR